MPVSIIFTKINEFRAEEEANKIKTLQGRLLDCNKVVDMMNTNSELREIEDEVNELRQQNTAAEESYNELLEERHAKEEAIRELEKEIEEEKARNLAAVQSMDPSVRESYEEMNRENEELLEEYRLKQDQLNELNRKKGELEDDLARSPLKQQAMMLHERLTELEAKKLTITNEINAEGTPDEQRERLLQTVIRTTGEINAIQKQ
ncbi:unnamed protein product [Gongylonema pulchrum]|uniref:HOOK domain-containing protein n=1 Tax=Gongylonema pulchrum TaxID=637853 RepID=A0A183D9B4_9BILA|nr:unnamed protein product [Gongylonema pulchrum]